MKSIKQLVVVMLIALVAISMPSAAQGAAICNTRDPCKITLEERSDTSPALAVFGDRLYLAWTGTDQNINVMSSLDGQNFERKVTLDERSDAAPALAVFGDRLYLAWTGTDAQLNLLSSADGMQFGSKVTIAEESASSVALAAFEGRLYLGWTGTDHDDHPNLLSSADGVQFGDKLVFQDDSSRAGLGLSTFRGVLNFGWTGVDENQHPNLFISTDGQSFEQKMTFEAESSAGTLALESGYMAWTGTDGDHHLNLIELANHEKRTLDETATGGPALTNFGGVLYLAWAGTDGDHKLNIEDALYVGGSVDSDGDGLLDDWETHGYDANNDGIVDVDLPHMGANPNHKDLFLELDWMLGHEPTRTDIRAMKDAFAAAPANAGGVINPDGQPGINLWIDTGVLTNTQGLLVGDNLGGGNQIASQPMCGIDATFYSLKANNFNRNRRTIFRYAIRAPSTAGCDKGGQGEIGGNDFADHNFDGGSTMHELGHNLGLRHGGFEDHNCKPNYLSVMNYVDQKGIPQVAGGTVIDFSPPRFAGGRGRAPLPTLVENQLSESLILDPTDPTNELIFVNGKGKTVKSPVNQAVDWNGEAGAGNPFDLPINIDTANRHCANDSTDSTLAGYDDWSHISLPFWQFGNSDTSAINPVTEHEATAQELQQFQQVLNTTDLTLTMTQSRDVASVGQALVYTLNVINNGPNQADQVQMTDTLPDGLLFVNASVGCVQAPADMITCDLGALAAGTSRQLTVTVLISAQAGSQQSAAYLTNSAQVTNQVGPDSDTSNNSASTVVEIINHRATDSLLALYTLEEGAGTIINDVSGVGVPLNLQAGDTAAAQWTLGGLTVISPTLLVSAEPAAKITSAISATGELTLEGWVRSQQVAQANDGSIVALATDIYSRDMELSQLAAGEGKTGRYEARLRTSATSRRGQTLRTTRRAFTADLRHIVLTRDALGVARLYVNGVQQATHTIKGDLSGWLDRPLVLANDLSGSRPWLGEYQLVALYSRALSPAEVGQNFRAGPSGDGSMPVMLGLHARYTFDEGGGTTIHDTAAVSMPLDLQLRDASAVQWTPDGLAITAPTMLTTAGAAERLSKAISATGELTLEALIQPATARQQSLARIATLSDDSVRRNVELIQEREDGNDRARYTIRLRTSETARDGKPPLQTPRGTVDGLQHVVYTRDAVGLERIYINGVEVARSEEHSNLSNWDTTYRLVLANTLSGDRPWLGEYRLFAIYNRALSAAEVGRHFRSGAEA